MAQNNDDGLMKLRGKTYFENFTVEGIRYRGSLKTGSLETAIIIATKRKSDLQLAHLIGKPPEKKEMTLDAAFAKYWLEHAHDLSSHAMIELQLKVLRVGLGGGVLLSEITPAMLTTYAAQRRLGQLTHVPNSRREGVKLANATVNGELKLLRAVMNLARDGWGINIAEIEKWSVVLLEDAGERQHILGRRDSPDDPHYLPNQEDEETRLFKALRTDFHAIVRFGLLTGIRLRNMTGLTWTKVKWSEGVIEIRVKSKKPGGRLHYVPISPKVEALLMAERGHHPQRVFTFLCIKNNRRVKQISGRRYPITAANLSKEWARAIRKADLWYGPKSPDNMRLHDLRHTAATRAQKKSGNLKTVQKLLGHKDIATTARYAKTDNGDVLGAMDSIAARKIDTTNN